MAFIAQTAFLPRMWNNRNEDLQNIPGLYGAMSAGETPTFVSADCSAGFVCSKGAHIPGGGYQMTTAADGTDEVYFCNPGDVQRVPFGDGQLFAVGVDTLSLGAPAGRLATYSKAIPGETYAFGPGNFSTLVDATTNKFAVIQNGLLKGQAAAPTTVGTLYFELDEGLGIDTWTEANYGAFARYNLLCKRVISA